MDNQVRVFKASPVRGFSEVRLFGLALVAFGVCYLVAPGSAWMFLCPAPSLALGLLRLWRRFLPDNDRIEVDHQSIRSIVGRRITEIKWTDVAGFGWLEPDEGIYPLVKAVDGRELFLWADQHFDELQTIIAERTGLSFTKSPDEFFGRLRDNGQEPAG